MEDCLFCKIIAGKLPTTKVYENDDVFVIKDIYPKANTHLLLLPRVHIDNVLTATEEQKPILAQLLYTAKILREQLQIADEGVKLIIRNGKNAGQEVNHLHVHFMSDKSSEKREPES